MLIGFGIIKLLTKEGHSPADIFGDQIAVEGDKVIEAPVNAVVLLQTSDLRGDGFLIF